jgi:hypothetical protein
MGLLHALPELPGAEPMSAELPYDLQPNQEAVGSGLAFTSAADLRTALLKNLMRHNT